MANEQSDLTSFSHDPLSDAKAQIRLLQFLPGCDSEHLFLQQSTWEFNAAPEFKAISYTWGDPGETTAIVINGRTLTVRRNCFYALWQAQLHYSKGFVWIDSVCIDQSNLEEKSIQVAMMGELYSSAQLVLICVGPSAMETDVLIRSANDLYSLVGSGGSHFSLLHENMAPGWQNNASAVKIVDWILSNDRAFLRRLFDAFDEFGQRPYWQRMWIIQEVACARSKVVLCGAEKLLWCSLNVMHETAAVCFTTNHDKIRAHVERMYVPYSEALVSLFNTYPASFELSRVFTGLNSALCHDARDRLYGALRLIDWGRTGTGPITPDYTICVHELALQILPDLPAYYISSMLRSFDMDCQSQCIRQKLARRRPLTSLSYVRKSPAALSEHATKWGSSKSVGDSSTVAPIMYDKQGRLTAALERRPALIREQQRDMQMPELQVLDTLHSRAQNIFVGDDVAVLSCNATAAGDVLVPLDGLSGVFLVLRRRAGLLLDIVGQAIALDSFRLPNFLGPDEPNMSTSDQAPDKSPGKITYAAHIRILLSDEDQLLLWCQDHRRDLSLPRPPWHSLSMSFDPQARLERLETWVTAEPEQSVSFSSMMWSVDSETDDHDILWSW